MRDLTEVIRRRLAATRTFWLLVTVGLLAFVGCLARTLVSATEREMNDWAIRTFVLLPIALSVSFLGTICFNAILINSALHEMARLQARVADAGIADDVRRHTRYASVLHKLICYFRGTSMDEILSTTIGESEHRVRDFEQN